MRYVVVAGALWAAAGAALGNDLSTTRLNATSRGGAETSGNSAVDRVQSLYGAAMNDAARCLEKDDYDGAMQRAADAADLLVANHKYIDDENFRNMHAAASRLIAVAKAGPAIPAKGAGGPQDLLQIQFDADRIKHERVLTLYNVAMENARKALYEAEWDTAIRRAEDAINIVEQNKAILSGGEYADLRGSASRNLDVARARHAVTRDEQQALAEKEAARAELIAQQALAAEKRKVIKTLRNDARKMQDAHRYIEAIDLYKRLLQQVPDDQDAQQQLRLLQDTAGFRAYDRVNTIQAVETTRTDIAAKEAAIPYSDILSYPEDWVETTRLRK